MQENLSNIPMILTKKFTRLLDSYTKLFSKEDAYHLSNVTTLMIYFAQDKMENNDIYINGINLLLTLKPRNYLLWLPKVLLQNRNVYPSKKYNIASICNLFYKYTMNNDLETKLQNYTAQHKLQHLIVNFPQLFDRSEIKLLKLELLNISKHIDHNNISTSLVNYFRLYNAKEYHAVLSLRYILATHLISLDHQDKHFERFKQNIYKTICLLNNGPSNAIRLQNELMIVHKNLIVNFCFKMLMNQKIGPLQDYFDMSYDTLQVEINRLDNEANFKKIDKYESNK